jgi:hypothetical protein
LSADAVPSGTSRLWSPRTAVTVAGVGTAGVVAMIVAWSATARTIRVERQVDWIPLGVAGAAALTLAMVAWVLSGRRAVAVRLAGLATLRPTAPAPSGAAASAPVAAGDGSLVAAERMVRYHRSSCPLVAAKPTRPASRSAHEAAGRRPCGMCEP